MQVLEVKGEDRCDSQLKGGLGRGGGGLVGGIEGKDAGAAVKAFAGGAGAVKGGQGTAGGDLEIVNEAFGLVVALDNHDHIPFVGLDLEETPTAVEAKLPDGAGDDGLALIIQAVSRLGKEFVEPAAEGASFNAMGGKPERILHT